MVSYFDVLAVFVAFLAAIVAYYIWTYKYWERRNVPYIRPSIPFGSIPNPIFRRATESTALGYMHKELRERGCKYGGAFRLLNHMFIPVDLELIKNILTRDFQYFSDRGMPYRKNHPIAANLFVLDTKPWRHLRMKLTPTFTSGKMKMMFPLVVECSGPLLKTLDGHARAGHPVDIKEALGCFTTDVIGTCAFGIDCNSFENPNSDFRRYGKAILIQSTWQLIRGLIQVSLPFLRPIMTLTFGRKDISKFFLNLVKDTIEYRKTNNIVRNDFMQLLINMGDELTLEEKTAQAFLFFLAGFETSSTTSAFALYELATNPEVQTKLREEVREFLKEHNGQLKYDAIHEMKYMTQVVEETLRIYAPAGHLVRKSLKDYKIPDSDVVLEAGTPVFISLYGLHHDPEYFPEPEKFDPERFNEENKKNIDPFSYMPFGEGPRNCIGLRFGLMQTKAVLAIILNNYEVTLNPKTASPLIIDSSSLVTWVEGGIWLNLKKIQNNN